MRTWKVWTATACLLYIGWIVYSFLTASNRATASEQELIILDASFDFSTVIVQSLILLVVLSIFVLSVASWLHVRSPSKKHVTGTVILGVFLIVVVMSTIFSPIYSIAAVAPQAPSVVILESYLWPMSNNRDAMDIDTDTVIQVKCTSGYAGSSTGVVRLLSNGSTIKWYSNGCKSASFYAEQLQNTISRITGFELEIEFVD